MEGIDIRWRTSSFSGGNGGECIEIGNRDGLVLVRDSKDRQGAVLQVPPGSWRELVARVKDR